MATKPRKPSRKDLDRDADGQFCVEDPEIAAAAEEIRTCYTEHLWSRYGIRFHSGATKRWIWYRAAEFAQASQLTPRQYTLRQLAEMEAFGRFWPEGLASPRLAWKAQDALEDNDTLRSRQYMTELLLVEQLEPHHGPKVYRDPFWPLSPVVRFCLACAHHDHETASHWRQAAALEGAQYPSGQQLISTYEKIL